ncbi:MAG: hypothetical protein VKO26_09310 [Cyanobacteriota bacterium]|nr:hypothetical protein [Cyanobacteriota bacterium]
MLPKVHQGNKIERLCFAILPKLGLDASQIDLSIGEFWTIRRLLLCSFAQDWQSFLEERQGLLMVPFLREKLAEVPQGDGQKFAAVCPRAGLLAQARQNVLVCCYGIHILLQLRVATTEITKG